VAAAGGLAAAAATGLAGAVLPGRIEVLSQSPCLVVDAAHTAVSARLLAGVLQSLPRRRSHGVLSISAGKNIDAILGALLPCFDRVTLTIADRHRSAPLSELVGAVRRIAPSLSPRALADPITALRVARAELGSEDLLCATGSIYLAGIARRVLRGTDSRGGGYEPTGVDFAAAHGLGTTK
jgi:dihydrofolate synthase/folylpolyglutamate synthase